MREILSFIHLPGNAMCLSKQPNRVAEAEVRLSRRGQAIKHRFLGQHRRPSAPLMSLCVLFFLLSLLLWISDCCTAKW